MTSPGSERRLRLTSEEVQSEARRRLFDSDQRLTGLRRDLLDVFLASNRPLSVSEVIESAPRRLPLSSVYRNLTVLCDAGVLRRLNFDEGFVRYELEHNLTSHHHHLVCSGCQSVLDIEEDALAEVEDAILTATRRIRRRHGFRVQAHHVDLEGVCAACASGRTVSTEPFGEGAVS